MLSAYPEQGAHKTPVDGYECSYDITSLPADSVLQKSENSTIHAVRGKSWCYSETNNPKDSVYNEFVVHKSMDCIEMGGEKYSKWRGLQNAKGSLLDPKDVTSDDIPRDKKIGALTQFVCDKLHIKNDNCFFSHFVQNPLYIFKSSFREGLYEGKRKRTGLEDRDLSTQVFSPLRVIQRDSSSDATDENLYSYFSDGSGIIHLKIFYRLKGHVATDLENLAKKVGVEIDFSGSAEYVLTNQGWHLVYLGFSNSIFRDICLSNCSYIVTPRKIELANVEKRVRNLLKDFPDDDGSAGYKREIVRIMSEASTFSEKDANKSNRQIQKLIDKLKEIENAIIAKKNLYKKTKKELDRVLKKAETEEETFINKKEKLAEKISLEQFKATIQSIYKKFDDNSISLLEMEVGISNLLNIKNSIEETQKNRCRKYKLVTKNVARYEKIRNRLNRIVESNKGVIPQQILKKCIEDIEKQGFESISPGESNIVDPGRFADEIEPKTKALEAIKGYIEKVIKASKEHTKAKEKLKNELLLVRGWMPQNVLHSYRRIIDGLTLTASTEKVPVPTTAQVGSQTSASVASSSVSVSTSSASSTAASVVASQSQASATAVISPDDDISHPEYAEIQRQITELKDLRKMMKDAEKDISHERETFEPVLKLKAVGDIDLNGLSNLQGSVECPIFVASLDDNGNVISSELSSASMMSSSSTQRGSTIDGRERTQVKVNRNIIYYEFWFDKYKSDKGIHEETSSASSAMTSSSSSAGQQSVQEKRMRIYMQDFLEKDKLSTEKDNLHIKGEVEVNFDDVEHLIKVFEVLKKAGFAAVELGVLLRESRSDKQKALFKLCCKASVETGLPLKIDGKIFELWDLKDSKKGETIKIPSAADKRFPYFWRACTGIPISEVSEVVKQTQRCCIAAD